MKRLISPRLHGIIDYATTAATAAAPLALDLPPRARNAAEILAGGYGGMAAMTDYPLGVKRMIPFKGHGAADALLAVGLVGLPWILGVAKDPKARNFFLGLAAVSLVVTALTDWDGE